MRARRLCVLLLLAASGLTAPLCAQPADAEAGRPFLTNFAPTDYDADTQNWAVVEDKRGVMYFGNNSGLLEYDGVAWQLIRLPNRTTVRSLARGADGRIWVGGDGELGYLAPDSLGRTAFVSLRAQVPEAHRGFADVWNTYATDEGLYFNVSEAIFRWDGQAMQVWPAETLFHQSFVVEGRFYVRQWEVGLMRLEATSAGEELRLVPGGERFAQTRIYVMLPFGEGRILIGTREEGLFLYDGSRFEPFETEADGLLAQGGLYLPGAVLPGGRFALGTLTEGLLVLDRAGRLVQHLDRRAGLQDNAVYYPYEARSGDLWLGLGRGLARVELGSSFTQYDAQAGVPGQALSMARHAGRLYVGTSSGLITLDPATGTFRPVESPSNQVFALRAVEGELLAGNDNEGVYRVVGGRTEPVRVAVSDDYDALVLHAWSRDPSRVLVGLGGGLGVLRKSATGWVDEGRVPGVDVEAWYLAEAPDGTIWVGTQSSRLARVRLPDPQDGPLDLSAAEVALFGPEDGLQEGQLFTFRVGDEVYITGEGEAVYVFDEQTGRFIVDHAFDGARSGHPLGIFFLREDHEGRVWIASTYGAPVLARPQPGGTYTFEVLRALRTARVTDVYPEPDGVAWLLGADRLIRYDTRREATAAEAAPPLVRRVAAGDDLLYGGAGEAPPARLPHGAGALHLAYAAPGATAAARFRTRLDGFDEAWSAWSTQTEQTYTNLPPGAYTFRVEAEARGETAYAFRVLPPWYRTVWAYGLYAVFFALGVFGVDRVQRRRLLKKERERSALREAQLRAEAAESQAQAAEATAKAVEAEAQVLKAENERKQNVELLSRIGQAITSTLSVGDVIETVYEHVNALMDASVFGIGIYNEARQRLDFPATKEKGVMLPPYANDLDDENRLAVWCFKHRKEIVIGDFAQEHGKYLAAYEPPVAGEDPVSVLYLPLIQQDRVIGVITTQSFAREAYTDYHVNLLRTLAVYAAIALDNASAYRKLDATVGQLNKTVGELQTTQQQLIQQEKLASLGQLTSGIAHEIKNPLNFINNFAEVNEELARELSQELAANRDKRIADVLEDLDDLVSGLKVNAAQITKHGRRADAIVQNMMEHAQGNTAARYEVNLNKLIDEYVDLAYHGVRSRKPAFEAAIARDYDPAAGNVEMAPQEMGRVLVNLLGNAFDAVEEKTASPGLPYAPRVTVATRRGDGGVEIRVSDNGPGIPSEIREKIFEPFFTTKPTGSGTGLGLSLSYDIVTQGHGGTLAVESADGEGATFVITLPSEASP